MQQKLTATVHVDPIRLLPQSNTLNCANGVTTTTTKRCQKAMVDTDRQKDSP